MCNFALMLELILAINGQMSLSAVLFWVLGALLVTGALILIFLQQRTTKELQYELSQLSKMNENNVEFEFVLKALRLATWHIDPAVGTVTYDYDFRDKGNEWIPLPDGTQLSDSNKQLHKDDVDRVAKSLNNICSGKIKEYHEQYRVMIPHTEKYYWEESSAIAADRDIDGKPLRIVGTSMRIDEQKRMEEALVVARNKAEESDRLKSAFIANMSHEIRTPLNAIIGFTSLLPDVTGNEERAQLIGLIQENNQKLLRIIDDVMNISKIEAGNVAPMISQFDLNLTLTEVIDKQMPKVKEGVELTTQFAQNEMNINTDLNRLLETMNHLVQNAVKFTDKGNIVVGYDQPKDKKIRIWVKDTGKGIPEDLKDKVFERFFKVDEFIPGAGLGLSICQTMVHSLDGTLGVESKLNEGSLFWLEIPC